MTTDLWMLIYTTLLCVLMPNVYVLGLNTVNGGWAWGLGNRDEPLELPLWAGRAKRAHANLVENLAPFAVVVLVAHVAGKDNATTALGSQIFFAGRVGHFLVYTMGVPYVRTGMFAVSVVGFLMILLQLF